MPRTTVRVGESNKAIVTLRQRLCPPELLGRVTATMRFLIMGMFPLGARSAAFWAR